MNFELLNKDNSVSVHYNNTHALAMELYKVANDMYPEVMSEFFKLRDTPCYNLPHTLQSSVNPVHSVYDGPE